MVSQELGSFSGAPLFARDLARALLRRGHDVVLDAPEIGALAERMREEGIRVVSRLGDVPFTPDIVHGNHLQPLLHAMCIFPRVPAIQVAHGIGAPVRTLVPIGRIRRHVAVDELCRRLLAGCPSIPPERISVMLNFVDLQAFPQRPPLPERPRRALIFSNYAQSATQVPAIDAACRLLGIPLDVIGEGTNHLVEHPGRILGNYDLVFAKARCAIEAMAAGTAVVVCDWQGLSGMVTTENFEPLRRYNFGHATLKMPLRPDLLAAEIDRYSASDAGAVSDRIRQEASLDVAVERWIEIYRAVVAEGATAAMSPDNARLFAEVARRETSAWAMGQARRIKKIPFAGPALARHLRRFRYQPVLADERPDA